MGQTRDYFQVTTPYFTSKSDHHKKLPFLGDISILVQKLYPAKKNEKKPLYFICFHMTPNFNSITPTQYAKGRGGEGAKGSTVLHCMPSIVVNKCIMYIMHLSTSIHLM